MHAATSFSTPDRRSSNPVLEGMLKKNRPGQGVEFEPAASPQANGTASFTKIHSESLSSEYPDASHARKTREKNLHSQETLIQIGKLEVQISALRKELKVAESQEEEKTAAKIRAQMNSLESDKKKLIAASRPSGRRQAESLANPDGEIRATSRKHGSKPTTPLQSGNTPPSTASGRSAAAGSHASTALLADERMVLLNEMVAERQARKKVVSNQLAALNQTHAESKEISAARETLRELQEEIDTLTKIIPIFSSPVAGEKDAATPSGKPSSSQGKGSTDSAAAPIRDIIRRTTTRQRGAESGAKPLKRSENPVRNSTLYPQGVKHLLNTTGKQLTDEVVKEADTLSDELDALLKERFKLQQSTKVARSQEDRQTLIGQARDLDQKILSCTSDLNRIVKKAEAIENAVLPKSERLPAAEREKRYADLLERFKSDDTRKLEATHKQLLDAYIRENASGTNTLAMLGGAIANLCTFSVGSAATRALGAYGMAVGGTFGGAAIAGALHAVLTLPILKQVMRETWTSPILAEYNNHWKLLGASWGDWWRGEQDKAKYASKDPGKTELLTIEQRLAEDEGWFQLFLDRFRVEELPYFTFMGNYISKGFASGTRAVTSLGKSAYVWSEGSMHLPMGWISGAETSVLIQEMRSQLPTAKLVPIPSRELAAAEAACLESLLRDLTTGLGILRSNDQRPADDPSDREMLKAMAKTRKALASANMRSQILGTLRQEIKSQFTSLDAFLDTLAEAVARFVVLLPSSGVSYAMAAWRLSPDPLTAMLGHIIPAVLLILPPGWTARGLFSGLVRAALQAIVNGRAPDIAAGRQASVTTTTRVPSTVRATSPVGSDAEESSIVTGIDSETSDESSEESIVVGSHTEGDITDSDEEWEGQAKKNFVNF